MEALDKSLERVTTALAYFACAIVTLIFSMIVIDVSVRAACTASFKLFGDDYACSPPSFGDVEIWKQLKKRSPDYADKLRPKLYIPEG